MSLATLRWKLADGIAWITLARPSRMNVLDREVLTELKSVLSEVRRDDHVRLVVLEGEGKAFCAGGDVERFHGEIDRAPAYVGDLVKHFHDTIGEMLAMPKPILASVGGVVAGGGMGLFLAADLAVASESASFVMAYSGIGASPDGGTSFFLPRIVGLRRAMELTLTNRRLSAREAWEWGLVNEVVPDTELAAATDRLARRLADGPTRAYAQARALLRQSFSHGPIEQMDDEGRRLVDMSGTADFRAGVAAFTQKRRPTFSGS